MYYERGDDRINWKMLNQAGNWISEQYLDRTGNDFFSWKEKYGTMRYEFLGMAIKKPGDTEMLCTVVIEATKKFPEVDALIVDDLIHDLDEDHEPNKIYIQAFKAIIDAWDVPEQEMP